MTTSKNIVLYADDDHDDLQLVQESFSTFANNVEVLTATDGGEALSFLNNLAPYDPTPCLIILDINMPVLNGKEVLIKLRQMERFKAVPVVLFSTSSQPMDKMFAQKYEAGFVTKPLNVRQMEFITSEFINHCTEETKKNIQRLI